MFPNSSHLWCLTWTNTNIATYRWKCCEGLFLVNKTRMKTNLRTVYFGNWLWQTFRFHTFMHLFLTFVFSFLFFFNSKEAFSKLLQECDFSGTMQKIWHFWWLRIVVGGNALKCLSALGRFLLWCHLLGVLLGGSSHMSGYSWLWLCFLTSKPSAFCLGNPKALVKVEPGASWGIWTYWQAPRGSKKRARNHSLNAIIFLIKDFKYWGWFVMEH